MSSRAGKRLLDAYIYGRTILLRKLDLPYTHPWFLRREAKATSLQLAMAGNMIIFGLAIPIFIARGLKDRKDGGVKSPAERLLRKAEDEAVLALLNQKRAERGEETMLKSLPSQQENQVDDESLREQFYIWLEKFIKADTEDTCITDNDKRLLPPSRYVAAYRNYLKNLR